MIIFPNGRVSSLHGSLDPEVKRCLVYVSNLTKIRQVSRKAGTGQWTRYCRAIFGLHLTTNQIIITNVTLLISCKLI